MFDRRGLAMQGFVYTVHDVAGNILYVGMTRNVEQRMRQHRRSSRWWRLHSVVEVEEFPTLEAAARAEDDRICRHDPPFNVRCNHRFTSGCGGRRCRRLRDRADRSFATSRRCDAPARVQQGTLDLQVSGGAADAVDDHVVVGGSDVETHLEQEVRDDVEIDRRCRRSPTTLMPGRTPTARRAVVPGGAPTAR